MYIWRCGISRSACWLLRPACSPRSSAASPWQCDGSAVSARPAASITARRPGRPRAAAHARLNSSLARRSAVSATSAGLITSAIASSQRVWSSALPTRTVGMLERIASPKRWCP